MYALSIYFIRGINAMFSDYVTVLANKDSILTCNVKRNEPGVSVKYMQTP